MESHGRISWIITSQLKAFDRLPETHAFPPDYADGGSRLIFRVQVLQSLAEKSKLMIYSHVQMKKFNNLIFLPSRPTPIILVFIHTIVCIQTFVGLGKSQNVRQTNDLVLKHCKNPKTPIFTSRREAQNVCRSRGRNALFTVQSMRDT